MQTNNSSVRDQCLRLMINAATRLRIDMPANGPHTKKEPKEAPHNEADNEAPAAMKAIKRAQPAADALFGDRFIGPTK